MARLNLLNLDFGPRTHEGAPARNISPELQLRRSVMACLLWESQFYEDGVEIAGRIAELVPEGCGGEGGCAGHRGSRADEAASRCRCCSCARWRVIRRIVILWRDTLARVIQRADELSEFVAIYWKDGRVPLSGAGEEGTGCGVPQVRRVSARQVRPWRADQAARRALPLARQAARRGPGRCVEEADLGTSRHAGYLGGGAVVLARDKREAWERLLREQKLGALALLRNLRNMKDAGVDETLVLKRSSRDESGARAPVPLPGCGALCAALRRGAGAGDAEVGGVDSRSCQASTIVLVDVSGSMTAPLSSRSEMQRTDAAYGLAVLLREIGEKVAVYSFSDRIVEVPARRGFALRDAIDASQTAQQHVARQRG